MPQITKATWGLHSDNSLILDFSVDVDIPAQVWVEYHRADGRGDHLTTGLAEDSATHHDLNVMRLHANTVYCFQVFAKEPFGGGLGGLSLDSPVSDSWPGSFRTGPLPEGLAAASFTLVVGQPTSNPITLIEHTLPDFAGVVALDSEARVVWYYQSGTGMLGTLVQDPATLNLLYEDGRIIREMTPSGELVAESPDVFCKPSPDPLNRDGVHHEVLAPQDGKVLYIGRVIRDPFNDPSRLQLGDTIRQWDQLTGEDVELWDPFDFLNPINDRTEGSNKPGALRFWGGCDGTVENEDWTHANSIQVAPGGNIIMSIRHLDQIISIAPDLQSLEWRLGDAGRLGTPYSDFTFPDPSDQFYHQHAARELSRQGNTVNILLFDNGNDRPVEEGGLYTRALELELDMVNMTATKVWEYRHTPDLYAPCCSNATRLANGNTLVIFGSNFQVGYCCRVFTLVEADSDGNAVSVIEISSPDKGIQYRAYPVDTLSGESRVAD